MERFSALDTACWVIRVRLPFHAVFRDSLYSVNILCCLLDWLFFSMKIKLISPVIVLSNIFITNMHLNTNFDLFRSYMISEAQ